MGAGRAATKEGPQPGEALGGELAAAVQEVLLRAIQVDGQRRQQGGTAVPHAVDGAADPPRQQRAAEAPVPASVTPALHGRFMKWVGAAGKIRDAMSLEEWSAATAKRFAAKGWRARAVRAGLAEHALPTQRDELLTVMLKHMLNCAADESHPEDGDE